MGLRARLHELAKTASELEADEIRVESETRQGAGHPTLGDRSLGAVTGVLRSVTLPPVTSVPLLEAEIFDGENLVRLVWVGQRRIPGIEPGVFMHAEGRVCVEDGVPTIRNPHYELLPNR